VLTLTSTTFTSSMIVCVSATGWTSATIIDFPWNSFYTLANFGQFVILCPFKPHMWHAYKDVLCVFWLGCVVSMVATMVFLLSTCLHIVICHPTICIMFINLPYTTLCFC
jgi:hypothetical protein